MNLRMRILLLFWHKNRVSSPPCRIPAYFEGFSDCGKVHAQRTQFCNLSSNFVI